MTGAAKPSTNVNGSDVKSSRPKWPRCQNFGLGLKHLALALPRSRCRIMLPGIFGEKSCKNSGILLIFPAIILNRMLLTIWYFFHNYFWSRSPWPQPPEIGPGPASAFWPRLTSLVNGRAPRQTKSAPVSKYKCIRDKKIRNTNVVPTHGIPQSQLQKDTLYCAVGPIHTSARWRPCVYGIA